MLILVTWECPGIFSNILYIHKMCLHLNTLVSLGHLLFHSSLQEVLIFMAPCLYLNILFSSSFFIVRAYSIVSILFKCLLHCFFLVPYMEHSIIILRGLGSFLYVHVAT